MAAPAPMGRPPPRASSQGKSKASRVQLGTTTIHVYGKDEAEEISSGPGGGGSDQMGDYGEIGSLDQLSATRSPAHGCRPLPLTGDHPPTEGKPNAPISSLAGAGLCLASPCAFLGPLAP
eukprot:12068908-Heterocapsa_arctica.AAC.1